MVGSCRLVPTPRSSRNDRGGRVPVKVALVGSRVGYIHRGFESFTRNLFDLLKDEIDITLLKGAGPRADREIVIPSLWLQGGVLSKAGLRSERRMQINERTFALGMLPHLLRHGYDAIHFSEYDLGRMLLKWRRLFGLKSALIFSNGAPAPPDLYGCFDLIQEVTAVRLEEAVAYGIPRERLRLVPYGIDCDRFTRGSAAERAELRRRHGVPPDAFVVLCVAALKRHHKRLDVLIDAAAGTNRPDLFLVACGQPTEETESLRRQAEVMLRDRHLFLTLPHESMHEAYRLADLFVLPSLAEGFGIVIAEAMAAALPVLVNDAETFRWIVADDRCRVDMGSTTAIARRIRALADDPESRREIGASLAQQARARFDWQSLKAAYIDLYRDAAGVTPRIQPT